MEVNDLKNIWNAFNQNIDRVEKINKQALKQMISRKSEIKLQIMKFQSILGILVIPLILIFVFIPVIINIEKTLFLVIGLVLISLVFIYGFIQALNLYKLLSLIRPAFEPVIKTQERILTLKRFVVQLRKNRNILVPIEMSAIVLIMWDHLNYELPMKLALLVGTSIGIYFWGNLKHKLYLQDRIKSIDIEMNELKEYQ